jgi:hypothetical protein
MAYPSARRLPGRRRGPGARATHEESIRTMAKRQRGGARPGQRTPLQRGGRPAPAPTTRPAAPPKPAGGLSDDELARAAELEAAIVAEEQRATTATAPRGRDRRRTSAITPSARSRSAASLEAIAEDEYRYVVTDLRKIVAVFALVFGLLVLSWVLIVVTGLVEF